MHLFSYSNTIVQKRMFHYLCQTWSFSWIQIENLCDYIFDIIIHRQKSAKEIYIILFDRDWLFLEDVNILDAEAGVERDGGF